MILFYFFFKKTRKRKEQYEQLHVVLFGQTEMPVATMRNITEVADRQLHREGAQFTKVDLEAILIALETSYRKNTNNTHAMIYVQRFEQLFTIR